MVVFKNRTESFQKNTAVSEFGSYPRPDVYNWLQQYYFDNGSLINFSLNAWPKFLVFELNSFSSKNTRTFERTIVELLDLVTVEDLISKPRKIFVRP